jgi:anion-transporting  ArsA/GET3 family ATPase
MAEFFSSRLLRWLTAPARSRVLNLASRPFYQVADRILGTQFLQDIGEFFLLFQTMYDGFVERAKAVNRLVHDRRTTFVVVSTLEATPLREAEFFIDALVKLGLHPGALVLNKVLPGYLLDAGAARVAERLSGDAPAVAASVPVEGVEMGAVARVLGEVGESFLNFGVVAKREAEQRAELSSTPDVVASVPFFDTDIYDLAGLLRHGQAIWSPP